MLLGLTMMALIFMHVTVLGQTGSDRISPYFNLKQHYGFIEYAINRGLIDVDHVLSQPYLASELWHELEDNSGSENDIHWVRLLKQDLRKFYAQHPSDDKGYINLGVAASYEAGTNGTSEVGRYRAEVFGYYSLPYLVLVNRTATDQRFEHDPLFYGDTEQFALTGRVEDAYVLLKYKAFKAFAGRISRNYGIINEPSLILSDNPFSYDHFGFELDTKFFKFNFMTTRLNDMFGFTIKDPLRERAWRKRYISLHRAEFALRRNLHLGLTEVAIWGGTDQNVLSFFVNPVNFFLPAQNNQRVNSEELSLNGYWSGEALWKPFRKVNLFGQILIDDIEITKKNRSRFPNRLGGALKLTVADLPLTNAQFDLMYNRIDNWTYISFQTWENYVYHGKSLGYPKSSVENFRLGMDYFGRPPFIFSFDITYERLGDQSLENAFVDVKTKFPLGVVQKSFFVNSSLQFMPATNYFAKLTVGIANHTNAEHITGKSETSLSVSLAFFANLNWNLFL